MNHKFAVHRTLVPWLLCVGLFILFGCSKESSTEPEKEIKNDHILAGDWQVSFYALNETSCPVPEVTEGCGGAVALHFIGSGTTLQGSSSFRFACQTCGVAVDYGGSGPLEDLELTESNLSRRMEEKV